VRDLIIGIRVVLPDGTVAKAGGKVVKNVAGYDLAKLFTGSLGTLGLIAEANFRLHPLPEVARTVAVEVESPQAAFEAVRAVKKSQVEPTAIELRYAEDRKLVVVLVESIPGGIEAKEEMVSFLLKSSGQVRTLPDEETEREKPPLPAAGENTTAIKISASPAELVGVMESALGAAERRGLGHPVLTGHAATGVTYITLGGETEVMAEFVEEIREIWGRRGGNVVLLRAPVELKRRVGVWGPPADSIGLTRRVKEKFDPRGILSPGRFIGGI
jgi:glycolate oxidase FAD binding subunit